MKLLKRESNKNRECVIFVTFAPAESFSVGKIVNKRLITIVHSSTTQMLKGKIGSPGCAFSIKICTLVMSSC